MGTLGRAVASLTTFVVAGVVHGCGDATREPTSPDPSAPALFRATTTTTTTQVPTTLTEFVPCANGGAGEVVQVSGDLHVITHTTISDRGNLHIKFHFQPMGISGVGLTTGDKYQATGVTQHQFSSNARLVPETDTFINNFRLIGPGPDNNFIIHENFHATIINIEGDVTAFIDNSWIDCK